jgi:hypothetical protein
MTARPTGSAKVVRASVTRAVKRRAAAAARDRGRAQCRPRRRATGDFFCRCDADDWYAPGSHLGWQLKMLQRSARKLRRRLRHVHHGQRVGQAHHRPELGRPGEDVSDEIRRGVGPIALLHVHDAHELVRHSAASATTSSAPRTATSSCGSARRARLVRAATLLSVSPARRVDHAHAAQRAAQVPRERRCVEFQKQRLATGMDDLMRGNPPPLPTDHSRAPEHTHSRSNTCCWARRGTARRRPTLGAGDERPSRDRGAGQPTRTRGRARDLALALKPRKQ